MKTSRFYLIAAITAIMAFSLPTYADVEQSLSAYEQEAVLMADGLHIAVSKQANFPTFDKTESLEVASIEGFGGAFQFEASLSNESNFVDKIDADLTLDAGIGLIDTISQRSGSVPFRMLC